MGCMPACLNRVCSLALSSLQFQVSLPAIEGFGSGGSSSPGVSTGADAFLAHCFTAITASIAPLAVLEGEARANGSVTDEEPTAAQRASELVALLRRLLQVRLLRALAIAVVLQGPRVLLVTILCAVLVVYCRSRLGSRTPLSSRVSVCFRLSRDPLRTSWRSCDVCGGFLCPCAFFVACQTTEWRPLVLRHLESRLRGSGSEGDGDAVDSSSHRTAHMVSALPALCVLGGYVERLRAGGAARLSHVSRACSW